MVAGVDLPAGSRCIKYLMIVFNLLFVITGILLISFGTIIFGVYRNYEHFLDNKFFSVPSLLVAIGAIIFLIAFFGCCGALRENYCMILTFTSLLVLVFILELSGGISGYVLRSHAEKIVADKMNDSMLQYGTNKEMTIVWDQLQIKFECCGTRNFTDWEQVFHNNSLPMSCCKPVFGAVGNASCSFDSENHYKRNCLDGFLVFIKSHAVQLGGVGIGVAIVQLLGIWFSVYLAKAIKSNYETV